MALAVYDTARIGNKQAEALKGRALAARARGDLPAAIQFGEESLQRIEALRAGVSAPELRAFYSAAHSDYYESQIETLLAAHRETGTASSEYLIASLSVSERARARMIVDLLNEAAVPLDRGELPEAALERERELYDELGALRYQRDRLLETPNPETRAARAPGTANECDRERAQPVDDGDSKERRRCAERRCYRTAQR